MTEHEKAAFYWSGYGPTSKYTLAYWLENKDMCKQQLKQSKEPAYDVHQK